MDSSFVIAHRNCLKYEGGFSNHPQDPGGPTLEGVTQGRYTEYRKWKKLPPQKLTAGMRHTPEWIRERDEIYRHYYWLPSGCRELPVGVDACIYDYAVNSGPGRAIRVLQRLVGVQETGSINAATIQAASKRNARALVNAICDERMAFLRSLKTFPVFGRGWTSRVSSLRVYATKLAEGTLIGAPVVTENSAKGEVPDPKVAKNVTKTAPPAIIVAASPWWQWFLDNPGKTVLIAALIAAVTVLIVRRLNERRKEKQETPMPVSVVPEAAP